MSEIRIEEAEKNLAAVRTQLAAHVDGETTATDSSAKFQRWGDERRRLELEVERHVKLVEVAHQEDANDRRQELIAKADAQRTTNAKTAERLKIEGKELLQRAVAILRKVAAADAATDELNRRLPSDVPQIKSVDTIARSRPARPREDISSRRIELWVYAETGSQVLDQTSVVDRGDGSGKIPGTSVDFGRGKECRKRRYSEVEYQPAQAAEWVESSLKSLRLPYFDRPGMAWDGQSVRDAQLALNSINLEKPDPDRPVLIEAISEGPWAHEPRRSSAPKKSAVVSGD